MYAGTFVFPSFGGGGIRNSTSSKKKRSKKKKKKKKSHYFWFESCSVSQLKELCKATKLPVSGTKAQLCERLMANAVACQYGYTTQDGLKEQCKDKLLVQSGTKYDQVLRLLHAEFGTGTAKRAATETIVDESTGKEVQVLKKKRKTTPSPKTMYTRVEKKMKAVSQKKYQSHYGSKSHSPHVYNLMKDLIQEHCIDGKMVESEPLLALDMAKSVFQSFYDHWQVMERPGYETQVFRDALDCLADILRAALPLISAEQVEDIVGLLESIQSCVSGYCLHTRSKYDPAVYYTTGEGKNDRGWLRSGQYTGIRKAGENAIEETIRVVMPDYDKDSREEKKGKLLDSEIRNVAWMNDFTLS